LVACHIPAKPQAGRGGGLPLGQRRITPCFSPTRVSSCPDLHPARRAVCVPRIPRVDSRPPDRALPRSIRGLTGPPKQPPCPSQKGLRHRWIVSSSRSAPGGSPVPAPRRVADEVALVKGQGSKTRGVPNPGRYHPGTLMRVPIGENLQSWADPDSLKLSFATVAEFGIASSRRPGPCWSQRLCVASDRAERSRVLCRFESRFDWCDVERRQHAFDRWTEH
jgi:hypothetical protein